MSEVLLSMSEVIQYLESRIQECLGLPYEVQNLVLDFLTLGAIVFSTTALSQQAVIKFLISTAFVT